MFYLWIFLLFRCSREIVLELVDIMTHLTWTSRFSRSKN